MFKLLYTIFAIAVLTLALSACQTTPKPAVVYQPQIVNVPVAVLPEAPVVDKFESRVLQLTDTSSDGSVGQAYKQDWLSLMLRDKIFVDFLNEYRKAKNSVEGQSKSN